MRASELMDSAVVAADGASLGPVRDIRVVVEEGKRPVVRGVVVGQGRFASLAHAWGFAEGRAQGPWLFRRLTRQASRAARFAPAERVADWGPGEIRLAITAEELQPLDEAVPER